MDEKGMAILADKTQTIDDRLQEILRERARILGEVPAPEESGEKISILSFQLGEELYGIELRYLTEMRKSIPLRHIPCAPSHLIGIINLRGDLLPVVDFSPILGLPQRELAKILPALLVLSFKGDKLAVVVDRAQDILTFPLKELRPPPISLDPDRALFIKGELVIENRPLSLLDVEKMLQDPRFLEKKTELSPLSLTTRRE
jgi:purine-binding chemotaxis protein CheW